MSAAELARWSRSPGVPSALAAARDAVDVVLRDRGLRRTTPDHTTEALIRGAAASALLEGPASAPGGTSPRTTGSTPSRDYETALLRLRSGAGGPTALAAARLNAGLLTLVPVISRAPLQALARMHTLVAPAGTPAEELGRPRPAAGVAPRLQELAAVLARPVDVSAIALAGWAHAEVAALAPFGSGNGLVARGLERLVLVARGVDPTSVTVPEAGHLALSDGYRAALASYSSDPVDGGVAWLLHVCDALAAGASISPLLDSNNA